MVKLNRTLRGSIVKRRHQQQSIQVNNNLVLKDRLVIDRTCPKQRQLEQSFARLNAELAKKDSELNRSGRNIIMEILNIPPVIDLANVDNESTAQHHDQSDLIMLDTSTESEVKNVGLVGILKKGNIQKRKRRPGSKKRYNRRIAKMNASIASTNSTFASSQPSTSQLHVDSSPRPSTSQVSVTNSSTFSDIDLRDANGLIKLDRKILSRESKQKAEQRIKLFYNVDNTDKATPEPVASDIDMRRECQQISDNVPTKSKNIANTTAISTNNANNCSNSLKYTNEELLHICSQQQKQSEIELNDYKTFISRFRIEHRSLKVDSSKNYQLVGLRYFQEISGNDLISASDQFIRIPLTVVSFNVLCQHYINILRHLYTHLKGSRGFLATWNSRKEKLQEEFNRIDADIFCLQEVQDVHFEEFYQPYFSSRYFEGIFTRKTGGSDTPDGCAIFWRKSKLTLLRLNQVSFNLNRSIMEQPNVGQIAIFGLNESLNSSTAICVSNTHIFFNMKRGTIKLAQIAYLLGHMGKMENEFLASLKEDKKYNFVGHILCGDFNIEPTSPLHRFLIDQIIDLRIPSPNMAKTLPYFPLDVIPGIPLSAMSLSTNCEIVDSNDKSKFKQRDGVLTHGFSFASVYEHFNIAGEPEISSYHFDHSTPDFIFYSVPKNKCQNGITTTLQEQLNDLGVNNEKKQQHLTAEGFIQLQKRLSLPTLTELDKNCGKLPNEQYGSDHLLICAKFDILCPLIYFLMFYYYY